MSVEVSLNIIELWQQIVDSEIFRTLSEINCMIYDKDNLLLNIFQCHT